MCKSTATTVAIDTTITTVTNGTIVTSVTTATVATTIANWFSCILVKNFFVRVIIQTEQPTQICTSKDAPRLRTVIKTPSQKQLQKTVEFR